jgi:hypothetical protein
MNAFQRVWYVSHFPALAALCLMIALVQLGEPAGICGAAEEKALPSDLAVVPSDGPIFITIRIGDLMSSKLGKELLSQTRRDPENVLADLEKNLGLPLADIDRLTILPGDILVIRASRAYNREKLLDALAPKSQRQKYQDKTYYHNEQTATDLFLVDDEVFIKARSYGPGDSGLERLWKQKRNSNGVLAEALQVAAQKHHIVAGLTPNVLLSGFAMEQRLGGEPGLDRLVKQMPLEFLPFKPLLLSKYATVTGDINEELKLDVRAAFLSDEAAKDGEVALKTGLYVIRELMPQAIEEMQLEPDGAKPIREIVGQVQAAMRNTIVAVDGAKVNAAMALKVDPASLGVVALQLRSSAERTRSINNLRQILLAFHNFHDTMGFMPPATIYSQDGKPLLSWRVAILPYIEEDKLYKQFKLDEPWDGPNNKKLLEKMPKVYAPIKTKTKQPYMTYYQVFTGPLAPFQMIPDFSKPFGARGPRLPASFPDGTSNTLLVVEAAEAVPWSKPQDLVYDEKKPVPKLGAEFSGGFLGALGDGSVRFFPNKLDEQILRYLIMPADGMPIDWDAIEGKPSGLKKTAPVPPPVIPRQKEPLESR